MSFIVKARKAKKETTAKNDEMLQWDLCKLQGHTQHSLMKVFIFKIQQNHHQTQIGQSTLTKGIITTWIQNNLGYKDTKPLRIYWT